ncbi:MAG TPA: Crp/Fnr family transcriptional regulator [Solirubrobacteraceae bacterium]|nr:Crp/Fnr family transcriptional regulator [Solirubrobacteraceae bacterium]
MASPNGGTPNTVSLLDVEPDLGCGIEPQDWEAARQATRATLIRIDPAESTLPMRAGDTGNVIGLIVHNCMINREIVLGEHVTFELLTPGDVLLLPAADPDDLDLDGRVTLTALNSAELIVLSKPFIHAAARWPSLLTNLHRRLEAQRHRFALQGLAAHLPRAEDRLLLTLWILTQRFGRVTPEGTVLRLSLSHEDLGRLAAARRPTITLALRSLETAGYVDRRPHGHLTLGPTAHKRVQELTTPATSAHQSDPASRYTRPSN